MAWFIRETTSGFGLWPFATLILFCFLVLEKRRIVRAFLRIVLRIPRYCKEFFVYLRLIHEKGNSGATVKLYSFLIYRLRVRAIQAVTNFVIMIDC